MGGTNSRPTAAAANAAVAVEEQQAEHDAAFSLSAEMQRQLAQDFHDGQVLRLFGEQLRRIGERRADLSRSSSEQRSELQERMAAVRRHDQQVQRRLDATLEGSEDRFADLVNAVEYDAERLERKYVRGGSMASAPATYCGRERSDVVSCYGLQRSDDGGGDPLACDAFVRALARCAENVVVNGGGK